jgi:aspartate kinase
MEKERGVTGIAYDINVVKVGILKIPDKPGIAAKLFGALAKENINVDMIIQSVHSGALADMAFTVGRHDHKKAVEVTEKIAKELKAEGVVSDPNLAKVSIVGTGMVSQSGVAAAMFSALSDDKINIEMISTSEIKISCVINENQVKQAVQVLHKKFGLASK